MEILKKCNNNNIIKLFGYSKDTNNFYLIFELIDGGNLKDLLNKHYNNINKCLLNDNIILNILLDISNGMKYLHTKNILHRDLKAENILIEKYTNIGKISDLGCSTIINKETFKEYENKVFDDNKELNDNKGLNGNKELNYNEEFNDKEFNNKEFKEFNNNEKLKEINLNNKLYGNYKNNI